MVALPLRSLPVGFRFHPTDQELVNHYLKSKINGRKSDIEVIPEVDVCKCEPWDLPDKSVIRNEDPEWFFFAPRDRKYPNGHRSNRATEAGYWKATGKDRTIKSRGVSGTTPIGMKKTLVFYRGRAPKGERTNWIMHEYRTTEIEPSGANGDQGAYVLCRLFKKPEERSPNQDIDEVEGSGFSPTPTRSSPGDTQHAADVEEEFENPSNQEISKPDVSEDPLPSLGIVENQPNGIERWLADEADSGTTFPPKPEENHCNSNMASDIGDNDSEVVAEVDPLLDALAQFDEPQLEMIDLDGLPRMDSPYLQYIDYPFLDDFGQGIHMDLFPGDNSEQDVSEFLNAVFSNQDEYSSGGSYDQKDSAANIDKDSAANIGLPPISGWDSGKDSESSSGVDMEVAMLEAQSVVGTEASERFYRQPFSSLDSRDSSQLDSVSANSTGELHFNNVCRKGYTGLLHQGFGPVVSSVDSAAESVQELFHSPEESTTQKSSVYSVSCLNETGIKIRSRQPLRSEGPHILDQGTAVRRIRLQSQLRVGSVCSTGTDDCEVTSTFTEVEKHVQQQVAKEEELPGPVHVDKHESSDYDETNLSGIATTPVDVTEEFKPVVRWRKSKKYMGGSELEGPSLQPAAPKAGSPPGYMAFLIPFAIILVLCIGLAWLFVKT